MDWELVVGEGRMDWTAIVGKGNDENRIMGNGLEVDGGKRVEEWRREDGKFESGERGGRWEMGEGRNRR